MVETLKVPCIVEAAKGEVLLECGPHAVLLHPEVAFQAGKEMQQQAMVAQAKTPIGRTLISMAKE